MDPIGIYLAADPPGVFFDVPPEEATRALAKAAVDLAPPGDALIAPPDGTPAIRIGEIVLNPVLDGSRYTVNNAAAPVGKPAVNRKPSGDPGTWTIQSLIFPKDRYTPAQARAWIKAHSDRFGDYGMDATANELHFRQYDPTWFSATRRITFGQGITANNSRIAATRQKAEDAARMFAAVNEQHAAMRKLAQAVNEMIIKDGLTVIDRFTETTVAKADGEPEEERFVMSLVLEPNDGTDGPLKPDTQKDVYSAAEIRKAAQGWMEAGGAIDLQHNWTPFQRSAVAPCQSFIAPCDYVCGEGERAQKIIKGTWMLALHVLDDDLWTAVKAGKLGAYSIGGAAERTPVAEGELHGQP